MYYTSFCMKYLANGCIWLVILVGIFLLISYFGGD